MSSTCTYEEAFPVATFGWATQPSIIIPLIQKTLGDQGYIIVKVENAEFLEFDSPNPTHACGYWNITLSCPKPEVLAEALSFLTGE